MGDEEFKLRSSAAGHLVLPGSQSAQEEWQVCVIWKNVGFVEPGSASAADLVQVQYDSFTVLEHKLKSLMDGPDWANCPLTI